MRSSFPLLLLVLVGCAYVRKDTHTVPLPLSSVSANQRPAGLWTLHVIGAELPPRMPSGLPWDDDKSGPDPFVRLYVDGRRVWESPTLQNTTQPRWDVTLPASVMIPRGSEFRLEIWDRDTAVSADPMGAARSQGLPSNALPDAEARLTLDNLANVTVKVTAPSPSRGVGLGVEIRPDAMLITEVKPYSPASRAGLRTGESVVGIGGATVRELSDDDAFSRLSLALDSGAMLMIDDGHGNQREVKLDKDPLWVVM